VQRLLNENYRSLEGGDLQDQKHGDGEGRARAIPGGGESVHYIEVRGQVSSDTATRGAREANIREEDAR
jgi:hypothetical protein